MSLQRWVKKIMYFVYILRTDKNTLYTGITNDLEKRIKAHCDKKGAKYTKGFKTLELVYSEKLATKSEALKREWKIKKLAKINKEKLVSGLDVFDVGTKSKQSVG